MLRKFLPIMMRRFSTLGKILGISVGIYTIHNYSQIFQNARCFEFPFTPTNKLGQIIANVVRIEQNDQVIGYAYCFQNRFLVTTIPEFVMEKKHSVKKTNQYKYYVGNNKLETKFHQVGYFEHLTFLEAQDDFITPMPAKIPQLVTPVQILRRTGYLSVKPGYYVADDCGYGIIDGKGQIGSLVTNDTGVVGIVTQVGRDSDRGFLRMIRWIELSNILKRIQEPQLYLGISAKALEEDDGISIVRIASNSPLTGKISMGDIITKVNDYKIHHPDDLYRVIMVSGKSLIFEIEDSNKATRIFQVNNI